MSALRPARLGGADLSALVTDPDLESAEGRLSAVLATRASQASVDNLGNTLGPAIEQATADKATAAQVAAVMPAGMVQKFLANKVPAGWQPTQQQQPLVASAIGLTPAASSSGLGYGDAVYVSQGSGAGLWRMRNSILQRFDLYTNKAVGPEYPIPATASGTASHRMAVYSGTKLYLVLVPTNTGTAGTRAFSFDTESLVFTQLQSVGGTLTQTVRSVQLKDGRVLLRGAYYAGVTSETQATRNFVICDPLNNTAPVRLQVPLPFAGLPFGLAVLPSGSVLVVGKELESDGQTGSCLLTVSGDTITAGPNIPTGYTTLTPDARALMPTPTGAYHGTIATGSEAGRVFTEGVGWSNLVDGPLAYGNVGSSPHNVTHYPDLGWLVTGDALVGGGGLPIAVIFTNSPVPYASVVEAIKL